MKIIFLGIGKTKHKFLEEGIARYKKLLSADVTVEEKYLKEGPDKPDPAADESARIIKNLPEGFHVVLLDIEGKRMSSEKFSVHIGSLRNSSSRGIVFVIGGSDGVTGELKAKADLRLSFSDMTMTHQMIRLFLIEQIYRAFSIINNKKYHK